MGLTVQLVVSDSPAPEIKLAIKSDSSAARGICNRIGFGKVRRLAIKELWVQEVVRQKQLGIRVVDAPLNWGDVGAKARAAERLSSLGRQIPLRRRERGQSSTAVGCLPLAHFSQVASGP